MLTFVVLLVSRHIQFYHLVHYKILGSELTKNTRTCNTIDGSNLCYLVS